MNLSRRSLLSLPATGVLIPRGVLGATEYRFHHDHIMGTSLDLVVLTTSEREAETAEAAVLGEIARLSRILSTYDPRSEISRRGGERENQSPELSALFAAYDDWNHRSGGAIATSVRGKLNVDALGKPFIAARAVEAARRAVPGISGIMLDAGGDVIMSGGNQPPHQPWTIGVSNPQTPFHNAPPLSILHVSNGAVATSGITARGAHIIDPRTGVPATSILSATVIARDAITANALSTAICVKGATEGLQLVERTRGAECLIIPASGQPVRSAGFGRFERPVIIPAMAATGWPDGYEVVIDLNLKDAGSRRPYIAVWVEDMSKHVVRNVIVFYLARKPRYLNELHTWFSLNANNPNLAYVTTRPTPSPGRYTLHWDGLDDDKKPVSQGTYKVFVETAREHSYYEKEFAQIVCADAPASAAIKKTPEFDAIPVTYGPGKRQA